ncbi:MAG: gamma carbonic anhydrase family protein [Rhodopirellula sp.]|nr:gamma carbonic anhydrase family protein [Rhodopirellula sp.]
MNRREIQAGFQPDLIAEDVFIAGNATVRGSVTIGDRSSVWFGAVVRGDTEAVEIGCRSNVQDLAVLHADPGYPCRLGDDVTVGHSAVVHGAIVESGALIGIRAVVLNGAKIGTGAIVGAGAVVTEGMEVPAGHLAVGIPAKVIRRLTSEDSERLTRAAAHYVLAAESYRESGEAA